VIVAKFHVTLCIYRSMVQFAVTKLQKPAYLK